MVRNTTKGETMNSKGIEMARTYELDVSDVYGCSIHVGVIGKTAIVIGGWHDVIPVWLTTEGIIDILDGDCFGPIFDALSEIGVDVGLVEYP